MAFDNTDYDIKNLCVNLYIDSSNISIFDRTKESIQDFVKKIFDSYLHENEPAIKKETLFVFPRSKPLPDTKKKTKWETFADRKGIQKRKKRCSKVFDENLKSWVPRHGPKSSKNLSKQIVE